MDDFLSIVQNHERSWGNETYLNRPSMKDVLVSPIVVFWNQKDEKRQVVTVHDKMKEIEEELVKAVLRSTFAEPKRRIYKIYANQKEVCIKGVKIKFDYCNPDETL